MWDRFGSYVGLVIAARGLSRSNAGNAPTAPDFKVSVAAGAMVKGKLDLKPVGAKAEPKAKKDKEKPKNNKGKAQEEDAETAEFALKETKDAIYSSVRYQAKKGAMEPLNAWRACQSKEDQLAFFRQWKVDKKFTWLALKETHQVSVTLATDKEEGWLSRYQVASEEKLPVDSELLQELLAELPSRAHRSASWASKGEKEYYYVAQAKSRRSDGQRRELTSAREAKATEDAHEALANRGVGEALRAIEDGPTVKVEKPEEAALQEKFAELVQTAAKQHKAASDLHDQALAAKGRIRNFEQQKPYLKELRNSLEGTFETFTGWKDSFKVYVAEVQGSDATVAKVEELTKRIAEGEAHLQAFKTGPLKDACAVTKF